jgi:hypothetical protein
MSYDFDPSLGVSAPAGDIPEITISAADRPPGGGRREGPDVNPGRVETRMSFLGRRGRIGAAIAVCSLAGAAAWGLYGLVAPHYAGWTHLLAAKFAQIVTPPVDLVPVTQKLEAEIQALRTKVAALEKARNATTKSLASLEAMNSRLEESKSESKAEVGALSSRVSQLQQETNAKFAEMSAARAEPKRKADRVASKPADLAEKGRQSQTARPNDAFDPARHPNAPGAPRPLGEP